MIAESVAWIFAATTAVIMWGSYGLWHNGYNIWIVDDIGKLTSYIFFPGEADLNEIAFSHRPGRYDNLTDHPPCILCSKTVTLDIPKPDFDTTWTIPAPYGLSFECTRDKTTGRVIKKGGTANPFLNFACALAAPGQKEPENFTVYDFNIDKNCRTVKGMGGMPDGIGVSRTDYILRRLFPGATSLQSITMSDINTALFKSTNPYIPNQQTSSSNVAENVFTTPSALHPYSTLIFSNGQETTGYVNVITCQDMRKQINIHGTYHPVSTSISLQKKLPFIPPLLPGKVTWHVFDDEVTDYKEYVVIEQILRDAHPEDTILHNPQGMWGFFCNGFPGLKTTGSNRRERLTEYFKRIGFTAFQTMIWNKNVFITLQYAPMYDYKKSTGATLGPPIYGIDRWSDELLEKYIVGFLNTPGYTFKPINQEVSMNKLVNARGEWRV